MPGFFAKYATVRRGDTTYTYRRHPVLRYFAIVLGIGVVIGALGPFGIALVVLVTVGLLGSRVAGRSKREEH